MICDAGGGTVVCWTSLLLAPPNYVILQDLAIYKIIGQMANLEIAEMCARSGANCGSLFLDLRFRELVKTLLADHPAHLDAASLAYFMHNFSETDKLAYLGEGDDGTALICVQEPLLSVYYRKNVLLHMLQRRRP